MNEEPSHREGDQRSYAVPLAAEFERVLSFQAYGAGASIEGVALTPIRKNRGENGWFAEIFRVNQGVVSAPAREFELRQVSVAYGQPFRINAFHIHPRLRQDESWVVLDGELTVWLIDCRRDSPTAGVRQRVQLTAEEPAILFIPAGVAHGYKAGPAGGLLLYGMNQQFDSADPNEGRIPWDHFGADIWEADRG